MYVLTPYSPQHFALSSHCHQSDRGATETEKDATGTKRWGMSTKRWSLGTAQGATGTKRNTTGTRVLVQRGELLVYSHPGRQNQVFP